MNSPSDSTTERIERELELVESAIAMVAGGHARRMQLGSLAFGTAVLPSARALAAERGVRVVPSWGLDDHCDGLVFERAEELQAAGA